MFGGETNSFLLMQNVPDSGESVWVSAVCKVAKNTRASVLLVVFLLV